MKRSSIGMLMLLLASVWAAGCGGGGGGGGNGGGNNGGTSNVNSVTVSPSGPTTLLLGQTVQLAATARDVNGNPIALPAANFAYTSSSAPNASVTATGLVTAIICTNPSQTVTVTVKESSSGKTAAVPITISAGAGGVGPHTVIFTSDRDGIVPSAGAPKTTNIYSENLDTGVVTQLTHNEGNGTSVNASPCPDGTKIAFASNRSGNYEIYMMNADGSNILPVTANGAMNDRPSFSPDSQKIIFESSKAKSGTGETQNNNGRDLFTVPLPTGSAVPTATALTHTPDGVFNIDAQYSPDNSKIAFAMNPVGQQTLDIWVMNSDGSNPQQRTNYGVSTRWPTFSPDGTHIVFVSRTPTNGAPTANIDIMNSDGSAQRILFNNGNNLIEPAYLPDGTIVYVSNNQLHLLNADGTNADTTAAAIRLQNAHTGTSIESNPHVRFCP